MTWWTGGALGFDTETDGPEPREARIITAAMVSMTPGNPVQPMELMLQPERDIPAEATAIHGISTERARDEGVLREQGIAQIVATIADLAGPERPVVGHNVGAYDLTLLDREMRRTGIGRLGTIRDDFGSIDQVALYIGETRAVVFPVIDTLVLDKAVDRYRKGKRRLEVTAAFYGVAMAEGSAHGATADVIASLRIAITIARRAAIAADGGIETVAQYYADRRQPSAVVREFVSLGARSLPDLHCAQVRWAAEQAEGLRDYFIKSGKTEEAASVSGAWPVRPLGEDETFETVDTTIEGTR